MHLRVWWKEEENVGFMKHREVEMSGIVVCGDHRILVRTDDGEIVQMYFTDIDRSEWVNHPTNAD